MSYGLSIRDISNDLEILNDLEAHSPVARFKKCNSTNIYAALRTVSTDAARRAVQLSFWFFPPEYALVFLAFTLTIKCLSFQESKSTSFPK